MNNSIKYLAFALALIYQAVIFRPLVSVVNYQVNKDFIAKNLCIKKEVKKNTCEGMCYLKKELEKVTEQSSSDSEEPTKRVQSNEEDVFHVSDIEIVKYANFYSENSNNSVYKISISDYSISVDVPPPVV